MNNLYVKVHLLDIVIIVSNEMVFSRSLFALVTHSSPPILTLLVVQTTSITLLFFLICLKLQALNAQAEDSAVPFNVKREVQTCFNTRLDL